MSLFDWKYVNYNIYVILSICTAYFLEMGASGFAISIATIVGIVGCVLFAYKDNQDSVKSNSNYPRWLWIFGIFGIVYSIVKSIVEKRFSPVILYFMYYLVFFVCFSFTFSLSI